MCHPRLVAETNCCRLPLILTNYWRHGSSLCIADRVPSCHLDFWEPTLLWQAWAMISANHTMKWLQAELKHVICMATNVVVLGFGEESEEKTKYSTRESLRDGKIQAFVSLSWKVELLKGDCGFKEAYWIKSDRVIKIVCIFAPPPAAPMLFPAWSWLRSQPPSDCLGEIISLCQLSRMCTAWLTCCSNLSWQKPNSAIFLYLHLLCNSLCLAFHSKCL